ncbi:MAG: hypothetical protein ACYST5_05625 [Planctomycetota bacterium]|jgi:hypothetical protein
MKRKMRKDVITKRVIQAIAVCFGLLGLGWICIGIHFAVTDVLDRDMFLMLFTSMTLIFGVVFVAIAYQSLRHFGPNSIKNVTGLAAFALYTILVNLVGSCIETTREPMMQLLGAGAIFILILPAYIFYSIVSRRLIQITETKNIQKDAEPDSENGAG